VVAAIVALRAAAAPLGASGFLPFACRVVLPAAEDDDFGDADRAFTDLTEESFARGATRAAAGFRAGLAFRVTPMNVAKLLSLRGRWCR
jgi:hypothetical protein